jgi:type I restriction enzyme S subunit
VFKDCKSKYENIPLSEVAEVGRGKSKHRPRNEKSLFGGKYPFVQTGDVRAAKKYIAASTSNYSEKGLAQSKLWPVGTVCITIAANIGDVAILGIDACFPDSVVGISSAENSNEFIYYFLITLQRQLDLQANSAAQKNINLKVLSGIQIPLPPLPEQAKIVSQLDALSERTQALAATTTRQLNQLTALKASLLDAAFRGQL